jgi:hypothetical protein
MIEQGQMGWLKRNQTKLQVDLYQGLQDAIQQADGVDGADGVVTGQHVGQRIILPSSFTGGP